MFDVYGDAVMIVISSVYCGAAEEKLREKGMSSNGV